jgi:hypothetical protein
MQVPALAFLNGPFTIYTSPSGMLGQVSGIPYLGGVLHEGDYCDVSAADLAPYQVQFGSKLYPGRYRFVRLSTRATAANVGYGYVVGYGMGQTLANAIVAAAGSGYTITATGASSGTVSISSSAAGGTAAVVSLTLSAGALSAAQVTFAGSGFTSVPTFTLSSVLTGGSGGSLVAEQSYSPNFISSFDSSSNDLITVRGVALTTITSAQVTAGAWMWIQEQGIAPLYVTTATATAVGSVATAATAAAVTTTTSGTAFVGGFVGYTIDTAAATSIVRVNLWLPPQQG